MNKAVFLDRDGVLNYDSGYVHKPEDLQVLPGVPEALAALAAAGFILLVVSNQSGIERGYFTQEKETQFTVALGQEIEELGGPPIKGWLSCPHTSCDWRKPNPGMLQYAAQIHNINLSRSYMVGDKMSDFEAGEAAGCAASFKVMANTNGLQSVVHKILEIDHDLQEASE